MPQLLQCSCVHELRILYATAPLLNQVILPDAANLSRPPLTVLYLSSMQTFPNVRNAREHNNSFEREVECSLSPL